MQKSREKPCGLSAKNKFLDKQWLWSIFTIYWPVTSCKKFERNILNIFAYSAAHQFCSQKHPISAQFQKIRVFYKQLVWSIFTIYWPLTSCKKFERNNLKILTYSTTHQFWSQKHPIWALFQKIRVFYKQPLWSIFTIYWPLTSRKKLERNILNILTYRAADLFWFQKQPLWSQYQKMRDFNKQWQW